MFRMREGQVLLEYVLAAAGLVVVVSLLWVLVDVTVRYAVRSENLVSSEYP